MAVCLFLASCSGMSSCIHFCNGTDYLNNGEIPQAIVELEKAVELDPSMGKYHTNLSAAYLADGNLDKCWYHCRQAVLCPHPDDVCLPQFRRFYNIYVKNRGLDKPGTTLEEIYIKLGEPDTIAVDGNQQVVACIYGACIMRFKSGNLTESTLY